MKTIQVTHANTKETISLIPEQIFYINYSPAHKCTLVASIAGAYCLVLESREEILKNRSEAILHNSQLINTVTKKEQ